MRIQRVRLLVATIIVGAFSFIHAEHASALEKVRILIPVRSIDEAFSPFVVAREKGFFASEGYDVELSTLR